MIAETAEFRAGHLRYEDYSLSDEQQLLQETYARLLATSSPPERVRAVEATADRFDHELWSKMVALGASSLGVKDESEESGTDNESAGLVDLALVAEEIGRVGAATPFVESAVIGRMLGRVATSKKKQLHHVLVEGTPIVSLALHDVGFGDSQLLPCGTVAGLVVARTGSELICLAGKRLGAPENLASAPVAWWRAEGEREQLAEGTPAVELYESMIREWKLLTAASTIGLVETVLNAATQYVKDRQAFGVPIGSFQAVSHPLVDVATGLQVARRLVWRAAWFADHEPSVARELMPMAVVYAHELATRAVRIGTHVEGGFGVTLDSDMQLYYRRAKAWPLLAGNPATSLTAVADHIRSPDRAAS
jgi:alkylation response protein AidB-like acyl-CoA dehydrogenase